jgi:restriction system protein
MEATVARRSRRKAGFLESLLAVFIAAVTLASLALTALLGVTYPDAVRLSSVGVGAIMAVYVLSVGISLAHARFPAARPRSSKAGAKTRAAHLPRGLVRRIDRRAGQRIRSHGALLARKRSQSWDPQARGRIDQAKWRREQDVFIDDVILEGVPEVHRKALKRRDGLISAWRRRIDAAVNQQDDARASAGHGIDFRPGMEGFEYEAYCARVLTDAGWKVWNKGDSGDQGVDLVAERGGVLIAIQCKRYRGSVGNSAVQEIYAGRLTVDARARAAVVSNADYTRSAKELATATGVLLLHHDELPQLADLVAKTPAVMRKAA